MPFFTYILQSEKTGRLYIGQTADLNKRLEEHNSGLSSSTRGHVPWKIIHYIRVYTLASVLIIIVVTKIVLTLIKKTLFRRQRMDKPDLGNAYALPFRKWTCM